MYMKLLQSVPAIQVTAHRIFWSFFLVFAIVLIRKEFHAFLGQINRKMLAVHLATGVLLGLNWLIFVWAVNTGYAVEASLGYFITPFVNVLLGIVILKERLRAWQWLPIGIAAIGVTWLTINVGSFPWIAISLAVTFGLYGLIKKISPLGSLNSLALETALIFLPAALFLLSQDMAGVGVFGRGEWIYSLLLTFTGVVTVVPLLLFSAGVRLIPLTTLGLLQYISPSLQFLTGVLVFHEVVTPTKWIGFAVIWMALILFTVENLLNRRKVLVESPA